MGVSLRGKWLLCSLKLRENLRPECPRDSRPFTQRVTVAEPLTVFAQSHPRHTLTPSLCLNTYPQDHRQLHYHAQGRLLLQRHLPHLSGEVTTPGAFTYLLGNNRSFQPLHLLGAIGTTSQEAASFSSQMGDPWGCQRSELCLSHGGGETWKIPCVTAAHLAPRAREWWGGWGAA